MEENRGQKLTMLASDEEAEQIKTHAAGAKMGISEYLRSKVFGTPQGEAQGDLESQLRKLSERVDRLEKSGAPPKETRTCADPEHARIYGVGHCFDCDIPMKSAH